MSALSELIVACSLGIAVSVIVLLIFMNMAAIVRWFNADIVENVEL